MVKFNPVFNMSGIAEILIPVVPRQGQLLMMKVGYYRFHKDALGY